MTEDLPDNPARWPDDPFAVLGVERGAADADIKRAYTRLIRRFKPEHHPDAFRRVREAYDACRQQAGWFRVVETVREVERPSEPDEPATAGASRGPVTDTAAPFHSAVDPADTLWDLAAEGRTAEAYAGLLDLVAVNRGRVDLLLRLYWLLTLDPELDAARTRHHWLAAALTAGHLTGPAADLYRRELETDPAAALGAAYDAVPGADADAADLFAVLRGRVAAAGRLRRALAIEADLRAAKPRLTRDGDDPWMWLLVFAKEWTAGLPDADAADFLMPLFDEMRHHELKRADAFDRADSIDALTRALHRLYDWLPEDLVALVRAAAADPHGVTDADVVAAATAAGAGSLKELLRRCDRCFKDGPDALMPAVHALAIHRLRRQWSADEELSPDALRALVRRLPGMDEVDDYAGIRPAVVRMLLETDADPDGVAAACTDDPDPRVRQFGAALDGDGALRLVWLISRAKQQARAAD